MSTVYAAVDERLDRLVAVKVMSSALSADPAFTDRFAREARAAARLTHLNVVSVYDQGHESGPEGHHVFLVMELVEGRTLRELLRERGRLSPAEAISIMEPVLSALAAAHRAGLVHRDVKPENILLSDDGVVKVADFGLARAVESDAAATRTGLMMGTVAYCAPEQISQGRADQRSDVYASGVVLFELLTGTTPYKGDSAMNVAYQHVHSRVPAPSSRVRGIPNEIDEIVIAATDSDPAGRPADAAAFLAEIADVRTELGLPVTPVPPRERPRNRVVRPEPRQRADESTTDMIKRPSQSDTSVVPRGVTGSRPMELRQDGAPPPPIVIPPPKRSTAQTQRRRRGLIAVVLVVMLGLAAALAGKLLADRYLHHVPNVVGQSQAAATKKLTDAGYHVRVYQQYSDKVRSGYVVSTNPKPGSRRERGKDVTINVSSGPHLYAVPSVRNQAADRAVQTLHGRGFTAVVQKPEASMTVSQGEATRTVPAAGAQVRSSRTITVYISTGPPILAIPAIDPNTPFDAAKRTLKQAGFKVTSVLEWSDSIGKNNVITIRPSDKAAKGSTITVTVSKGPQFVQIPNFSQLEPLSEVRRALEDLGLRVNVEKAFGGHSGFVVGVDPPSGTTVEVGSTVTVTIV